jgi:hypothetical protein
MSADEVGQQPQMETDEPARHVTVNVKIIDDNDPDHVECELSSPDGIVDNGRLVFKNQGHDGFWVKFHLTNTDEYSDYVFPTPQPRRPFRDAIWSKRVDHENESCPHEEQWAEFKQHSVEDDNKSVLVRNPNSHKHLFKFALRFTKDPQTDASCMCDPIGDNQNGPILKFR